VAIGATDGAVGAEQWKFRLGVIEAVDVGPGSDGVARFASEGRAIGAFARHLLVEFTVVRILVARGAGAVVELKGKNFVGAAREANLVAIGARYGNVCAHQGVARIAMLLDGISGAVPVDNRVAILAAVLVGSPGELVIVRILVAIRAGLELNLLNRVLSPGELTLRAVHLAVRALQGIFRSVVLLHAEGGRFPAVDGVALGAFPLFGASIELPLVRIRGVAILAVRERNFLFEIVL